MCKCLIFYFTIYNLEKKENLNFISLSCIKSKLLLIFFIICIILEQNLRKKNIYKKENLFKKSKNLEIGKNK